MATEAVENYLKAIYTLARESPDGEAGLTRLAAMVDVTPGTATTMVKKLAALRLVKYERYGGVMLTSKGERLALSVLRRHRILETFLVQTLGMDWAEVHDEAERLEHAVSDKMLDRLDAFLGRPSVDPHGDPIPDHQGHTRNMTLRTLAEIRAGRRVRVMRVTDQSASFLQFVARSGIQPGQRVHVESLSNEAGTVHVKPDGHEAISLSQSAARSLLVDEHER